MTKLHRQQQTAELKTETHRIAFEEMGMAVTRTLQGEDVHLGNSVRVLAFPDEDLKQVAYAFASYLASGAPRTVTVTASAPATWWDHVKAALANNCIQESRTNWGAEFGHWLSTRVTLHSVVGREEVARNVCPHISKPSHHRAHMDFVVTAPEAE